MTKLKITAEALKAKNNLTAVNKLTAYILITVIDSLTAKVNLNYTILDITADTADNLTIKLKSSYSIFSLEFIKRYDTDSADNRDYKYFSYNCYNSIPYNNRLIFGLELLGYISDIYA